MRCRAIVLAVASLIASPALLAGTPASAACTFVANASQLQAVRDNPSGNFCLAHDIDMAGVAGFEPIGDIAHGIFTGHFDGRGFAIQNLTITSAAGAVGLFGMVDNAIIHDLSLDNIHVVSSASTADAGGLVGFLDSNGGSSAISAVNVSGVIRCNGTGCRSGGMFGVAGGAGSITRSAMSAAVSGGAYAGGVVGFTGGLTINRTYVTGAISCTDIDCMAGGLVGRMQGGSVVLSFATGKITGADGSGSRVGGLIALTEVSATVSRSFAAGRVIGGNGGFAAGLIGQHNSNGAVDQTYAVGPVGSSGAMTAGSIASSGGGASITDSYWDTQTTGQATSVAGTTGLTTTQLRGHLQHGFGAAWDISRTRSYPFLADGTTDFVSPLATVVQFDIPYVFLPIGQFDDWEYMTAPAHADQAALATVYTMLARAIGVAVGDTRLDDAKIDKYFWDDATQTTFWRGPVKNFAMLGSLSSIPKATPLDNSNIIAPMNHSKLVILRGRYIKSGGEVATHWMLGTLYTKNADGTVKEVIADDPATGQQVQIDPVTKKVISPAGFPLAHFMVNGYRPVTLELPISDRRLKRDIVKVAQLDDGLGLYRYRYRGSKQRYVGVMAQEVAKIRPDAVVKAPDGYLRVNYPRLGLHLQTWREWLHSSKASERRAKSAQTNSRPSS